MADDNGNILAQIRQLRADAGQTLQGNEYFAMAQRLDAIVAGGDAGAETAQTKLQAIRDGLAGVSSQTADEAPKGILETMLALRATAGEKLHGNGYFSVAHKLDALLASGDLTSASAGDTLEKIRSLIDAGAPAATTASSPGGLQEPSKTEAPAAPEAEAVQTIMFPKANSFGTPQPTVSVSFAAMEKKDEAPVVEAQPENTQVETAAAAASSPATSDVSALNSHHAPEPEEKTGFDALTEASWRRVLEVAGPDEIPVQAVNGAAAGGMTADKPEPAHAAAPQVAQAEEGIEPETAEPASEMSESATATAGDITDQQAETAVSEPQPETAPAAPAEVEPPLAAAPEIAQPEEGVEPGTAEAGSEMSESATATAGDITDQQAETAVSEPQPETASVKSEPPLAAAPEAESASDGETVTAIAADQEPFRVIPHPTIVNRPVKKERFARLKRLAKLPYLPKRRK